MKYLNLMSRFYCVHGYSPRPPREAQWKGTNLNVRGSSFTHVVTREKNSRFICLSVYIRGFHTLKYTVCKLGDWYVPDEMRGRIEGYCFSSFFPFMDDYKFVYMI